MMALTEKLSTLSKRPIVGRHYLVPAVTIEYCRITAQWPVRGPMHEDKEFFSFSARHYHLDPRFVESHQARKLRSYFGRSLQFIAEQFPVHGEWRRGGDCNSPPRARLVEMKCVRRDAPYEHFTSPAVIELNNHFRDQPPIRSADGRVLCPHRRYDLSTVPVDADGYVTCPLHGLRVRCREAA